MGQNELLGVIGIFSHDGHRDHRDAIRQTWAHSGEPYGLITRFVMRGINSSARDEARTIAGASETGLPNKFRPRSAVRTHGRQMRGWTAVHPMRSCAYLPAGRARAPPGRRLQGGFSPTDRRGCTITHVG
eukprot:scaffold247808_cov35-Tisochrysis_lutea.AAC.5